jgi:hypothetical protein
MRSTANAWLRSIAVLALLPAVMANKGGCAPDVEMGDDDEQGGATAATSATGKGGATAANANGGSSAQSYPEKGGTSAMSYPEKGGSGAFTLCESKDKCGEQPSKTCQNGVITAFTCVSTGSGQCEWQMEDCPASAMCSKEMCGEQPNFEPCESNLGGAVTCEPDATGKCQWQQHCSDPAMCRAECGEEPIERGTCPDGSLKRYHCGFAGSYSLEKYVPCAELPSIGSTWIEEPCLTIGTCNGIDEVLVLAGYLATNLEKTNYHDNPAAARALCAEAFRQPLGGSTACIYAQEGHGYEFTFIDYENKESSALKAFVLPHGVCRDMTTQAGATTTVRTPTEGLWNRITDVVGVDLRELPKK